MKTNLLAITLLACIALQACAVAPATAPTPDAPVVEVGVLRVERIGDRGPAVILVPGLASGPWTWADTVARLRDSHTLYLVTLPGFDGRAAMPGATLDDVQDSLGELIARIRRPVLVGHSLGGTMALAVAAAYPDAVAGVIAVDGLPVFPGTEMFTDRTPLADRARSHLAGLSREAFGAEQLTYMKRTGVLDEATAARLAALSSNSDIAATAEFAAQLLALDLRPRLEDIKAPVIEISPFHAPDFAAMGVNEAAKTNYYRTLLTGVANLEVVSISPARHFAMFDQPAAFAAILDNALARMSAGAN